MVERAFDRDDLQLRASTEGSGLLEPDVGWLSGFGGEPGQCLDGDQTAVAEGVDRLEDRMERACAQDLDDACLVRSSGRCRRGGGEVDLALELLEQILLVADAAVAQHLAGERADDEEERAA